MQSGTFKLLEGALFLVKEPVAWMKKGTPLSYTCPREPAFRTNPSLSYHTSYDE